MILPSSTCHKLSDDDFFNRKTELANMKNLLYCTAESNPPEMLLVGVHGVGKSVLLNKIKDDLSDEGYLVLMVDFSTADAYQRRNLSVEGIIQHYYNEIVTQVTESIYNTPNGINEYFTSNDFETISEVSVPDIESDDDLRDFTNFVLDLPQRIYENNMDKVAGVIIIFDEFQIIKELDDYLDSFLKSLSGHVQNHNNVAYVFSCSMNLNNSFIQDVAGQNGVFGGRMFTHYLYPFNKEMTKKYLREKASQHIFTDESFEIFYECTKGIPSYINALVNHLPEHVTLTPDDVVDIFDNNIFGMIKHLVSVWIHLSNMEKDIIIELIDQPLQRKDLASRLNVKSGTLSKYLRKLIELELISNNRGIYSLDEGMLERWLKVEYGNRKVYPYRF